MKKYICDMCDTELNQENIINLMPPSDSDSHDDINVCYNCYKRLMKGKTIKENSTKIITLKPKVTKHTEDDDGKDSEI